MGILRKLSRRQWIIVAAAVAFLALAGWAASRYRYHLLPHHFYIVEPAAIYRGARQTPVITRRLIEKYRIRTIINLDDKVLNKSNPDAPDADLYAAEKAIARERGLQYFGFIWQGSGKGMFEEYDAVADILATTSVRPIFIHCAAGEKRTNAGIAAYWIRYRGYTLEQALEGLRPYGLDQLRTKSSLVEHLTAYYEYTRKNPRPGQPPAVLRGGVGHEHEDQSRTEGEGEVKSMGPAE